MFSRSTLSHRQTSPSPTQMDIPEELVPHPFSFEDHEDIPFTSMDIAALHVDVVTEKWLEPFQTDARDCQGCELTKLTDLDISDDLLGCVTLQSVLSVRTVDEINHIDLNPFSDDFRHYESIRVLRHGAQRGLLGAEMPFYHVIDLLSDSTFTVYPFLGEVTAQEYYNSQYSLFPWGRIEDLRHCLVAEEVVSKGTLIIEWSPATIVQARSQPSLYKRLVLNRHLSLYDWLNSKTPPGDGDGNLNLQIEDESQHEQQPCLVYDIIAEASELLFAWVPATILVRNSQSRTSRDLVLTAARTLLWQPAKRSAKNLRLSDKILVIYMCQWMGLVTHLARYRLGDRATTVSSNKFLDLYKSLERAVLAHRTEISVASAFFVKPEGLLVMADLATDDMSTEDRPCRSESDIRD
ncbi:hypothetical protein HETIRDRAFT_429641 [Heterobasidion irregulare TC 32-1]|uniref:Uncharacterized protein n=1 Tax=Heterobasidion irregulare (strain TC 32-1) TaxID=747525 RepID=W4JV16_HETIT|nr:uncharacterized protein HETIRDRAFT_429641 [Heterobasidion irregulare TC 32-1]ETW77408.1 hypothetical protein HETIRDRAFT_429641 [Heterobasidion irregulare TC 32-1]